MLRKATDRQSTLTSCDSNAGSSPMERFLGGVELAKGDEETASFVKLLADAWKQTLQQPDRPVVVPDLESLDAEDPSRLGYYYVLNEEDRSQHQLLVRVYQHREELEAARYNPATGAELQKLFIEHQARAVFSPDSHYLVARSIGRLTCVDE